ncbi:lipid A-modifier LpxR family protein [Maritimibacter sp. HL-12]|uniref:lipid A-modifier LpxR family protein n=1 Tax=Maritimibacter sp. HL-12 TaxID=1162418 RepID=UPI000A0F1DB8|nr:lipid A-modifier LpxR family protein [Maritimibacter sp. HL-12]SMH40275.1 hypothetical protein SAMN05661107_1070 [Maritimibacter sp. HL-12]
MRAALFALLSSILLTCLPASAQERATLGVGRLFTNDQIGDGQDRWRTGSYALSWMRGTEGTTGLPANPGEVIEYRFAHRILAPADLTTPAPGDRRYAGSASIGAFTHFSRDGVDFSLGGELVAVGPMTGSDAFQDAVHGAFGLPGPSAAVRAAQIPNAVYPTLSLEASRPMVLGGGLVLRPFVQARAGDETYARAGIDLMFGENFSRGITVRDETTGFLYQTLEDAPGKGLSFIAGYDAAKVFSSAWLPEPAYGLTPLRHRLRAGAHWQGERIGVFYGVAWLGPEFTAQPTDQVVGAVQLQMRF